LDIEESERKPYKYFINNFINTKKLLEVCVKRGLKNFIFSSTCAVYGNVSGKISEKKQPKPISVYGKTKLKCEKLIKIFSKKYKFNYGILRYFNVAGSDVKNKIGCINKNNQLIKNLSTSMKEFRNNNQGEYSLKQNFFDPSKSSPPNEFMIKLYMRMSHYTPLHIKVDNRESE
jgi:UDP-glucose 4-epimerase